MNRWVLKADHIDGDFSFFKGDVFTAFTLRNGDTVQQCINTLRLAVFDEADLTLVRSRRPRPAKSFELTAEGNNSSWWIGDNITHWTEECDSLRVGNLFRYEDNGNYVYGNVVTYSGEQITYRAPWWNKDESDEEDDNEVDDRTVDIECFKGEDSQDDDEEEDDEDDDRDVPDHTHTPGGVE